MSTHTFHFTSCKISDPLAQPANTNMTLITWRSLTSSTLEVTHTPTQLSIKLVEDKQMIWSQEYSPLSNGGAVVQRSVLVLPKVVMLCFPWPIVTSVVDSGISKTLGRIYFANSGTQISSSLLTILKPFFLVKDPSNPRPAIDARHPVPPHQGVTANQQSTAAKAAQNKQNKGKNAIKAPKKKNTNNAESQSQSQNTQNKTQQRLASQSQSQTQSQSQAPNPTLLPQKNQAKRKDQVPTTPNETFPESPTKRTKPTSKESSSAKSSVPSAQSPEHSLSSSAQLVRNRVPVSGTEKDGSLAMIDGLEALKKALLYGFSPPKSPGMSRPQAEANSQVQTPAMDLPPKRSIENVLPPSPVSNPAHLDVVVNPTEADRPLVDLLSFSPDSSPSLVPLGESLSPDRLLQIEKARDVPDPSRHALTSREEYSDQNKLETVAMTNTPARVPIPTQHSTPLERHDNKADLDTCRHVTPPSGQPNTSPQDIKELYNLQMGLYQMTEEDLEKLIIPCLLEEGFINLCRKVGNVINRLDVCNEMEGLPDGVKNETRSPGNALQVYIGPWHSKMQGHRQSTIGHSGFVEGSGPRSFPQDRGDRQYQDPRHIRQVGYQQTRQVYDPYEQDPHQVANRSDWYHHHQTPQQELEYQYHSTPVSIAKNSNYQMIHPQTHQHGDHHQQPLLLAQPPIEDHTMQDPQPLHYDEHDQNQGQDGDQDLAMEDDDLYDLGVEIDDLLGMEDQFSNAGWRDFDMSDVEGMNEREGMEVVDAFGYGYEFEENVEYQDEDEDL